MKRGLYIFPCNGNGLEALDCLGDSFEMLGWVDDDAAKQGQDFFGHPVFSRAILRENLQAQVLAVPGNPDNFKQRLKLIESLGLPDDRFATVVSPRAQVSPLARLGYNCLVMSGVVITSNAFIGNHVCVLPNSVVHHDAQVGEGCLIGAQVVIAGGVRLGDLVYVGSASSFRNGVVVGDHVLVGMGSNVVKDVASGLIVKGNPAKE